MDDSCNDIIDYSTKPCNNNRLSNSTVNEKNSEKKDANDNKYSKATTSKNPRKSSVVRRIIQSDSANENLSPKREDQNQVQAEIKNGSFVQNLDPSLAASYLIYHGYSSINGFNQDRQHMISPSSSGSLNYSAFNGLGYSNSPFGRLATLNRSERQPLVENNFLTPPNVTSGGNVSLYNSPARTISPEPSYKRRRATRVPDEQKDDHYWEKRRRNNAAAKRSRDAKKMRDSEMVMMANSLEQENLHLRLELTRLWGILPSALSLPILPSSGLGVSLPPSINSSMANSFTPTLTPALSAPLTLTQSSPRSSPFGNSLTSSISTPFSSSPSASSSSNGSSSSPLSSGLPARPSSNN